MPWQGLAGDIAMRLPVLAMPSLKGGPGAHEARHRGAKIDARALSACQEHSKHSAVTAVIRVPVGPQILKTVSTNKRTTITEGVPP